MAEIDKIRKMKGAGQLSDREAAKLNASSGRPKVGPADAETRRKKLREVLDGEQKPKPKSLRDAVSAGVDMGSESETLPNGQKRRAMKPKAKTKRVVKRFGTEGKTEEEMGL